uniref:Acetyl-CoA carboxylase n=1 Tax=Pinguiococcus pyrenoidosus TaxID=172671 RepID=A0A7R9U8E4_9STRA|mmetsp:Transcript_18806/g.71188  ORF Transcript_18806/g.71188 Transcript_18806/m.71188 type:complete len:1112 (+) Transcript_18806:1-3336(+)
MAAIADFSGLRENIAMILSRIDTSAANGADSTEGLNAVHILVLGYGGLSLDAAKDDASLSEMLQSVCVENAELLKTYNIRRVTFMVPPLPKTAPSQAAPNVTAYRNVGIFTYRTALECSEDIMSRHIEPPLAYHLLLPRLSNYKVRPVPHESSQAVHVYEAVPADASLKTPPRFFARAVSFCEGLSAAVIEHMFVECISAFDIIGGAFRSSKEVSGNHIFINLVAPQSVLSTLDLEEIVRGIAERYSEKFQALRVSEVELKVTVRLSEESDPVPLWLIISNPTGLVLKLDTYVQVKEGLSTVFRGVGGRKGELEGVDVHAPYPISRPLDAVRARAIRSTGTLYVYDWLEIFEAAVDAAWDNFEALRPHIAIRRPRRLIESVELVVRSKSAGDGAPWTADDMGDLQIHEISRPPAQNDVGMVAWLVTLFTPEAPGGRQMVVIANDITHSVGSFGTREDAVFYLASELARKRLLPRLYLAANSGARIGMAESIQKKFKIAWTKEGDPTSGFRYLYLAPADYEAARQRSAVKAELMLEDGEVRFRITDIIGEERDLGVENLMGSGRIAGETSRAYNEIFTLTLVVGRTVGIGAYLVRLGQRTIQSKGDAPIILTGYQALNKLMGKAIYTSNDQLGGPSIMHPNGVTHLLAANHKEAVVKAVEWLGFVPTIRFGPLPCIDVTGADTIDRGIGFHPEKSTPYDPRYLIAGCTSHIDGSWISGLFDKDSFVESLDGWAKTVVVGRARLGGVPVGVVMTEGRTTEALKPADPADEKDIERKVPQAGGVWFPDSAFKTAQGIKDFNGEDLPLFVIANWRGFSGGQRDMFEEVLKYGSYIVDALVEYKQPVFVYIPPFAELRGGAWVVIDSTINSGCMEMYADSDARGGVLEPNGAAEIKFKRKHQLTAMHRCDETLQKLDVDLAAAELEDAKGSQAAAIRAQIKAREEQLAGIYEQIAVAFADLHDTPGRMAAKSVIRAEVPWQTARTYFYWRLRRRIAEFSVCRRLHCAQNGRKTLTPELRKTLDYSVLLPAVKDFFIGSGNADSSWEDDRGFLLWNREKASEIEAFIASERSRCVAKEVVEKLGECNEAVLDFLVTELGKLSSDKRRVMKEALLKSL